MQARAVARILIRAQAPDRSQQILATVRLVLDTELAPTAFVLVRTDTQIQIAEQLRNVTALFLAPARKFVPRITIANVQASAPPAFAKPHKRKTVARRS